VSADLSSVLVEAGLNTDVGVNDQPRLAMSVVQITHKSNGRSSTERCHAPEHGISHWLICRYTTRPPAIVNVKVCGAMSSLSQATSYPLHNSQLLQTLAAQQAPDLSLFGSHQVLHSRSSRERIARSAMPITEPSIGGSE
jgi:hypothetical protein